ncbi:GbsR/MarR family transcriptional regulator [Pseudokineococcus sp. 1T1Z-3]|uniref:GbsR/MarR family transcriptional regulator n=1 Tax=Pseudokineococcus sp. 1T1Z-3 TaxID=3132745 RepID=UPI00309CCCA2
MADTRGSDGDGPAEQDPLDPACRRFVEDFGMLWATSGAPRMEGRVLAYLMVAAAPQSSSAELAQALGASPGSVSTTTRHLADVGFVQRRSLPGDRAHYFTVDDDVWGAWLASERRYLSRQAGVIERAMDDLAGGAEGADPPAAEGQDAAEGRRRALRRLRNGRNYMRWLQGYHDQMLRDWSVYKTEHGDPEER